MKLFKSLTLAALLFCVSLSFAQQWKKVKGNGNITTVTRSVGEYEGLKAAGSMDFKLVPGTEGEITIKGDSNLMEYIVTEKKGDMLVVKVEDGINIKTSKGITVTVPYRDINYVSLAGSGDVVNEGVIKADSFTVALAGSGDIALNVESDSVDSAIAGSGDISLKGSAKDLNSRIAGSGDFDGSKFKSVNVNAKISGSGDSKVVCSGTLKAKISGSGDLKYSGNPTSKDTRVSGSGSVRSY